MEKSPASEDTVTDWIAEFLRSKGIQCEVQKTTKLPDGTTVKPDLWVENDGVFLGEAEWENTERKGWQQVYTYSQSPSAAGTFLIVYPEKLKDDIHQSTLIGDASEHLTKHEYPVAFLRKGSRPDMTKVNLAELPVWLDENIYERREPETDVDRMIRTLRATVRELEKELDNVEGLPNLFRSVVGSDPSEAEMKQAARDAAAYILANQIAFYRILSTHRRDVKPLIPENIHTPTELDDVYFRHVREEIDYEPVFAPEVANAFSTRSLEVLRNCIRAIYALQPEYMNEDILGKVFHSLIPYSVRKRLGAHYTKAQAAKLLASIVVTNANDKVMDPACGSGTLLVAAYQQKKNLLGQDHFGEEDHRAFLQQDLRGLDVMPFAAHLSTIHLTLQKVDYEINKMGIAIDDSTALIPNMTIPSLTRVTPGAPQRKLEDFEKDKIETGAVTPAGRGSEIELPLVDVIIMNPPFTRQQRVSAFGVRYKDELLDRFSEYSEFIDKRMKYAGYFVFLADKFLNQGGRIGAVLPTNMLRGYYTRGLRKWLLNNYRLEHIVVREDKSNLSEDTDLREFLLVAKKGFQENHKTSFVNIKDLSRIDVNSIDRARRQAELGEVIEEENFRLRNVLQNRLDFRNLFREIALEDYETIQLWDEISECENLISLQDVTDRFSHRNAPSPSGVGFWKMTLNSVNSTNLGSDKWLTGNMDNETIGAQHIGSDVKISLARAAVIAALRRMTDRAQMDVTNIEEYVVESDFNGFDEFKRYANLDTFDWDEWKSYLTERTSNLFLVTRCNISAPGTRLLAYYSSKPRAASRAGFSAIHSVNNRVAKALTIWFNSTLNILQILIERAETEGAWMEIHKYVMKKLQVLNPERIDQDRILSLFDEIKDAVFPPLWKQFALLSSKDALSESEMEKVSSVFPDIEGILGKGFEPRRKIDSIILDELGISESDRNNLLGRLYPTLLKEIAILKSMMS